MASGEIRSRRNIRRRSFGKVSVIVVPLFKRLSTWMFPPCSSTTLLAKVNPNPTRSGRVEKKGSKIRSRFFLGIPSPLSEIETPMLSPISKKGYLYDSPLFPHRGSCDCLNAVFQNMKEGLGDEILVNEEIPLPF